MLEKMEDFFARRLDSYDQQMMNIEGADQFYQLTASQLPMEKDSEVLDLGCGTGLELQAYLTLNHTARVTGIDLSSAMLKRLASKIPQTRLNLICCSYFDLPLGIERYDAAVSVESLHHFTANKKQGLYFKLFDGLRVGGYFVLTDYFADTDSQEQGFLQNYLQLKRQQSIADHIYCHYDIPLTVEHEIQLLESAGFVEVTVVKRWGSTCLLRKGTKRYGRRSTPV